MPQLPAHVRERLAGYRDRAYQYTGRGAPSIRERCLRCRELYTPGGMNGKRICNICRAELIDAPYDEYMRWHTYL